VDAVCSFAEDTPLELIRTLDPDILVKGGDYKKSEIVGYEEVTSRGGEVVILPFAEGFSTSKIESKILDLYRKKKSKEE
jgi:D-beta-D-heptose 7-phosphate kinase/D-beta-D-heptose 1-phosphate adenosyltransferase